MSEIDIKAGSGGWLQRLRGVLSRSLHALEMTTPAVEPDDDLYRLCYDAAVAKGCIADEWLSPLPHLHAGVAFAQTAYAHVGKLEMRVYKALYVAFMLPIDDLYAKGAGGVMSDFIARMTSGQPQACPNLERFAVHLREASLHFDAGRTALFLASTFNWIISLEVDATMMNKEIPPTCLRFPNWCSVISGFSEATAMAIFPPDVPLYVIVPVIPDMMVVIRNFNDVFSFYKEELAGESENQITRLAHSKCAPKLDVLDAVADEAISAHRSICEALSSHHAAYGAWLAFAKGYAEFHYATKRYRLNELGSEVTEG